MTGTKVMTAADLNLPRFLPTLTEVVQTGPGLPAPAAPASELDAIVVDVMQRVQTLVEGRLAEELNAVLGDQIEQKLQDLRLRFWREIQTDVQAAVLEAIAQRSQSPS